MRGNMDRGKHQSPEDYVIAKYGYRCFKSACRALSMWPSFEPRLQTVVQELAEHLQINDVLLAELVTQIKDKGINTEQFVLNEDDPEILLPPVYTCQMGCHYVMNYRSVRKGDQRYLELRKDRVTECTICDVDGRKKRGLRFVLRCRDCESEYSYDSVFSSHAQLYFLYDQPRKYVMVSGITFWTRSLCRLLTNHIIHNQATFQGFSEAFIGTFDNFQGFNRKQVSDAFFTFHMEAELRSKGWHKMGLTSATNWIKEMAAINRYNEGFIYPHTHTPVCTKRGCGKLYCLDGIWKLTHRICAFKLKARDTKFPLLNLPDACPNAPLSGYLFCDEHLPLARGLALPLTTVEANKNRTDGITNVRLNDSGVVCCKKALGERNYFTNRSRGYLFMVSAGGLIRTFVPLYGSESVSQVFYRTVTWLYKELSDEKEWPQSKWNEFAIAYDNMCNLDALRQAQHDLAFEAPYDKMWKSITKIIDRFHLDNHVREACHTVYSPDQLANVLGDPEAGNTQAAEQLFSYLGKFKNALFSMGREHQLFFLHRIVLAINENHQRQLEKGIYPLHSSGRKRLHPE